MKRSVILNIILSVFLFSCTSSKVLYQKGYYDSAIDKAIKKIHKNASNEEEIEILDNSYRLANERNLERIRFLEKEENEESWDEIYRLYTLLNNRQSKVRSVLPLTLKGKTIHYEYIDYNQKIIDAKTNAAEYFYKHARTLLSQNTKEAYRQAYYEFMKVKKYRAGNYPNIDKLINDSREAGISNVSIRAINETRWKLDDEIYDRLLSINLTYLNSDWVDYYVQSHQTNIIFDYQINLIIRRIDISPEIMDRREYEKKETVQDGYDYVLDKRGNVMKDSLGNDIKVKKFKDLRCSIIERYQNKSALIKADIEFISLNPYRVLKKEPLEASTLFEHTSIRAIGDIGILNERERRLFELGQVPFPSDFELIDVCSDILNNILNEKIRANKHLIY